MNIIKDNLPDEPPSNKITIKDAVDIGSTDIPVDDTKSEQRMGFWNRLAQPILYPAGSAVCSRCYSVLVDIQK